LDGALDPAVSATGAGGVAAGATGTGASGAGDSGSGGGASTRCVPGADPVLIADAQLGPEAIAIDAERVYWTDHDTHAGRVMSAPKLGGAAVELAAHQTRPYGIAIDATHVYWTDLLSGLVQRVSKQGGVADALGPWQHSPWAIDVNAAGVFWTNRGSVDDGQLMHLPPGGQEPVELVGNLHEPMLVRVDATTVWWVSASSPGAGPGEVTYRAIDGGPIGLFSFVENPRELLLDETSFYLAAGDEIVTSSKQSGPVTVLADNAGLTQGLASDAAHVYWADHFDGIERVPLGGGEATVVAAAPGAKDVAVDDDCVYWLVGSSGQRTHDGSVWRGAK
jgi:hypothetical protein